MNAVKRRASNRSPPTSMRSETRDSVRRRICHHGRREAGAGQAGPGPMSADGPTRLIGSYLCVLDALARAGSPGRELGVRLDLMRSLGPRWAWHRMRTEAVYQQLVSGRELTYAALWRDAAEALDAQVIDLSTGFLEIRKNERSTRVFRQYVVLDDGVALRLALEKTLVYRLLAEAGLPVPDHLEFHASDLRSALGFLADHPGPFVLKPAAGSSGGSGATSGITTPVQAARARLRAARTSSRLIIERQAPGAVYRILVLEGEVLDVVRRSPPRVTGDGRSSVGELIDAENRRRLALGRYELPVLRVDLDCLITLENAGLRLGSVPAAGTTCYVKTVTNQNAAADNETVREPIATDVRAAAAAAAKIVGLRLAGVDLVAPDLQRPLEQSGGAIIEVNGGPGLHHHYRVADRAGATPVVRRILAHLLTEG